MKINYFILLALLSFCTMQAQHSRTVIHEYPLTNVVIDGDETTDKKDEVSWLKQDFGVWKQYAPEGNERYTDEGIVLTKDRTGASGFSIKDLKLDLRQSIRIEFEYAMAAVSGSPYQYGGGGMTFFLHDANRTFSIGYIASALGYSFNTSASSANKSGLSGAYLGIGFDLNGDSKARLGMSSYELREGITEPRYEHAGLNNGPDTFGDYYGKHITLRGAEQGGGYKGNPVLLTKYFGGQSSGNHIAMATLDYDTGEYDFEPNDQSDKFDISNGNFDYNPNFQKIIVEFVPNGEHGMYVTVIAKDDYDQDIVLIDQFYYQHSFKAFGDGGYNDSGVFVDHQYTFSTSIPDRVNIGFVATTMDNHHQKTIVKNVKITTVEDKEEEDDEEEFTMEEQQEEICVSDSGNSQNAWFEFELDDHDDYHLDRDSFEFMDEYGHVLGGYSYESNDGKWEYDDYDNKMKFTVSKHNFEPEDEVKIYYTIEGDNKSNGKRGKSTPTALVVEGIACGAMFNPHIQVKVEE